MLLLTVFPGVVLLVLLVGLLVAFVNRLLTDPNELLGLMLLGLVLGLLLFLWMQLPLFLQKGVKRLFKTSNKNERSKH